jgi:fumarate hydratase class I
MRSLAACARAARASLVGRGWGQPAKRHMAAVPFKYQALFEDASDDPTPYRLLTSDHVKIAKGPDGKDFLQVEPEALTLLSKQAMIDVAHLLRPAHLQQLSSILKDKEASENDKFVALELLKNANVAAGMVLPSCQDTGTGVCIAKRGSHVLTDGDDEAHISKGIYDAYTQTNLRYSQVAPQDMFKESNTKTNLPAQIDLYATKGDTYKFLYMAKGGGSANKTFLFQQTKALLNEKSLMAFVEEKVKTLGTAACPPYHIALVIGGLSADQTLKTVKLASTKYLDQLPTSGNELGRAFRDLEWEERIHQLCRDMGIGAQFGGKYFCHDVRVVRLPRHGASCPVGLGVSCSADRQLKAKINSVLSCLHTASIHTLYCLVCSCALVLYPFPEAPSAPVSHLNRDLQPTPA